MELTKARRAGRNFLRLALIMGWVSAGISPAFAASVDQVVKAEVKTDVAASGSQARIDKIVEETDDLAAKYRQTLDEIKALRVYNAQVETLIQALGAAADDDNFLAPKNIDAIGKFFPAHESTFAQLFQLQTQGQGVEVVFGHDMAPC